MTDIQTIQFEGRLLGYNKSRNKDGNWVDIKLQVHPDEAAPLNSIDLGQRLQCVVVPIDDDETPMEVKPKGGELARRAGILCGDLRFQEWLFTDYHVPDGYEMAHAGCNDPADYLREYCGVASRAELDHNQAAAERFLQLEQEFKQAHGMMAERR